MFFENAFYNLRFRVNNRLKANTKKKSNENFRTKKVLSRSGFNYDFNDKNLKNKQVKKREVEKV